MPAKSKSPKNAPKKHLTPAQKKELALKKELGLGVGLSFLVALLGSTGVCVVLLFGFQNGLPVTERCYCSWEKVIVFSIAGFLAIAAQLMGYGVYYAQCRKIAPIHDARKKRKFEDKQFPRIIGYTTLTVILCTLIAFLLLPFLVDQNHNFLWFVQSGMGILCIVITFLLSVLVGIFSKLIFTQEAASAN